MTIPLSTIKTTLRTWILDSTGFAEDKVIFANQNAPKPEKPYITINPVLTVNKEFMEDIEDYNEDEEITIYPVRNILASIHGFGEGSMIALDNALTYLDRYQGHELFRTNNLGITNRGNTNIKDLSYTIDDNLYVSHAQMDLMLQAQGVAIVDDSVGSVDEILVDIDIADGITTNDNETAIFILEENLPDLTDTTPFEPLNAPINITVTEILDDGFTITFEEG